MKKLLLALLIGFCGFSLVACSGGEDNNGGDVTNPNAVTVDIQFPGDVDGKKTIELYDSFDVRSGVTAIGSDGNNYSSTIQVTSDSSLLDGTTFSGTEPGTYTLNYSINFGNASGTATRTVVVNEGAEVGYNLLASSDFTADSSNASGIAGWHVNNEAGAVFTPQANGTIKVENQTCPGQAYQVRLNSDAFSLEKGQSYQVTFTISSTYAREVQVQVGELLATDPWFYQAAPDINVAVTPTLTKKSVVFVATETNPAMNFDNICLIIGMGAVNGQAINSDIIIGDISIHTYGGDVQDTVKPLVTQELNTIFTDETDYTADEVLAKTWKYSDDVTANEDLDIKHVLTAPGSTTAVQTLDTSVKGNWASTITVTDAAGNATTVRGTIVVRDRGAELSNYLTMKVDTFAPSGSDEVYSKNNPNTAVFWTEGGTLNKKEGTTMTETSITLEYAVAYNWYDPQFFLTSSVIDHSGTYKVSLDVTNITTDEVPAKATRTLQVGAAGISKAVVAANGVKTNVEFEVEVVEGSTITLVVLFNTFDCEDVFATDSNGVLKELLLVENLLITKVA